MDEYLKQQITQHLNQAQYVAISVNKNADFDAFASGLALFLSLSKTGKNININAKSPTIGDAQMLYGVSSIGKSNAKKNLIISIDNAVKNVDKVTYFLDGNKLKVVIHAFSTADGISEKDIEIEKVSTKPDLIIAIAQSSLESLKTDITHEQQIDPESIIININKDPLIQKYAQINLNEDISYAEKITGFIKEISLPFDEDIAFNLYAAIASATKMFSPNLVKPSTFEMAQLLLSYGAGKASFATSNRNIKQPVKNMVESFDVNNHQNEEPDTLTQPDIVITENQTPIESIETEKLKEEDWLKPPKIYRGSKSFDMES